MEYAVTTAAEVPVTDLSTVEEVPPDLDVQSVSSALGCENLSVNIWHFDEGEEIQYHAHETQEELFYVLDGTFSLKLGRSGEEEYREVSAGAFWAVSPMVGRGHRCTSENGGRVLAIGAPNVSDPGLDPHSLEDEKVEAALEERE